MAEENSGQLARSNRDRENGLQKDLRQAFSDQLLDRLDQSDELARAMATAEFGTLQLDRLVPGDAPLPSFDEMEKLLQDDRLEGVALGGIQLDRLIAKAGGAETLATVSKGMRFLKRGLYREAADWWKLHRPADTETQAEHHLLMTLMLVLTYRLAGQESTASQEMDVAKKNRAYVSLKQ